MARSFGMLPAHCTIQNFETGPQKKNCPPILSFCLKIYITNLYYNIFCHLNYKKTRQYHSDSSSAVFILNLCANILFIFLKPFEHANIHSKIRLKILMTRFTYLKFKFKFQTL